ncbi:hypothetical protein ACHAWF_002249, partial [Thalassiosira exigua]
RELLELLGVADEVLPAESDNGASASPEDRGEGLDVSGAIEATAAFAPGVNEALNARLDAIRSAERELLLLEEGFDDQERFVSSFAAGEAKDLVSLNVSGTMMTARRCTLRAVEGSVLARTDQDDATSFVDGWTSEDVGDWIENVDGTPDEVATTFRSHGITGRELLALDREGLRLLGIRRIGTACLLLEEIRKLGRRSRGEAPFFEHSPYCVEKILDYLRSKWLRDNGFIEGEPLLPPAVRASERKRFEKTVEHFFPGGGADLILGRNSS